MVKEYGRDIFTTTFVQNDALLFMANYTTTGLPEPPHSPPVTALLAFVAALISIATTVGNILVVLAFVLERQIRQPSNYLIASLAVTDILIGVFSMPFYTLYLLKDYWPLGRLVCDLWLSLDYTVCLVSQYTVFMITLDRFCSVKSPAKYRNWRTKQKIKVMIAILWLLPAAVFLTIIMGWRKFHGSPPAPVHTCSPAFQSNGLFTSILVLCYYWVTLVIMIGLYIAIYRVAFNLHSKAREKHNRLKAARNLAGNNNDALPLNGACADNQLLDASSNGNKKMKLGMENSESSRCCQQQDDSDISNDNSSDTVCCKTTHGHRAKHPNEETAKESPLWKPRSSIPNDSIEWGAFNESTCQQDSRASDSGDHLEREYSENTESSSRDRRGAVSIGRLFSQISNIRTQQKKAKKVPKAIKSRSENRAMKALRTITFILGAFILCWTPYHVVVLVASFCKKESCIHPVLDKITYWLCYVNSPINPFCYALANKQFKTAFIKILKGKYFKTSSCNGQARGCCKR